MTKETLEEEHTYGNCTLIDFSTSTSTGTLYNVRTTR